MDNRGKKQNALKRVLSVPAVLALIFLGSLIGTTFKTSPAVALPELQVRGDRIVEVKTGKAIRLRGLKILDNTAFRGLGDRQPKAAGWVFKKFMPLTRDHYDQIKLWGANTVAYEVWWTGNIGPTERNSRKPGVYDWQGLEMLRQHIRMAEEAGLYAMVLVRVCYDKDYAKPGTWHGWAKHDYVVYDQLDAAGKRGLDRFTKYLSWLTKNIATEPNLVAINPWQFPYHRQGKEVNADRERRYFSKVVPAMVKAIRQHTNKMIVIAPPILGRYDYNRHPGPFDDKNIIYGSNGYGRQCCADTVLDPNGRRWDYNISKLDHPDPSWKKFAARYDVPFMSLEGPGISQHRWPKKNGVPQLPRDRLDLFEATLQIVNEMDGWLIQDYGYPAVNSVLLSRNPNSRASEGAVVERIKGALLGSDSGTSSGGTSSGGTSDGGTKANAPLVIWGSGYHTYPGRKVFRANGGNAPAGATVVVVSASSDREVGRTVVKNDGTWLLQIENPTFVPCRVQAGTGNGDALGQSKNVLKAPANCAGTAANAPLVIWGSGYHTYSGRKIFRANGGNAPAGATVVVASASRDREVGRTVVKNDGTWQVRIENPTFVPCKVQAGTGNGDALGQSKQVLKAPANCVP